MSKKILVFAGTEEGRKICEFLTAEGADVTACTATDYGSMCISHVSGLKICEGRLSEDEIRQLAQGFDYVVDATHPFAELISQNIKKACGDSMPLIRIIRPADKYSEVEYFESLSDICRVLNSAEGNILATTGSKDILDYTKISGFRERVFARVLPSADSIEACLKAGFKPSNIICMQGPFTEEMNVAMLRQVNASYLVTKETGKSGGFEEKLSAAVKAGVSAMVVGRPCREEGLTIEETADFFRTRLKPQEKRAETRAGTTAGTIASFPLFVDLSGRKVVVVGGGNIAARRVMALLPFGPAITVIAPETKAEIEKLGNENAVKIIKRAFKEEDVEDAYIVLAATDKRDVNRKIFEICREKGIIANVCDRKEECSFYFPAIFSDRSVIGGLVSRNTEDHGEVKYKAKQIREFLGSGREAGL